MSAVAQKQGMFESDRFAIFRIVFGLYLIGYFLRLGVGGEVEFLFPAIDSNLVWAVFIAGAICALFFTLGIMTSITAILCVALMQFMYMLSDLTRNIGPGFYGFALLIFACVAVVVPTVPFSKKIKLDIINEDLLSFARLVLGWVLGGAYLYSGLTKFSNPIWRSGEAMSYIAKDLLFNWKWSLILIENPMLAKLVTWGVLGLELIYLPMMLMTTSARMVHMGMTFLFISIFVFMKFKYMIFGILLVHLLAWPASDESIRRTRSLKHM